MRTLSSTFVRSRFCTLCRGPVWNWALPATAVCPHSSGVNIGRISSFSLQRIQDKITINLLENKQCFTQTTLLNFIQDELCAVWIKRNHTNISSNVMRFTSNTKGQLSMDASVVKNVKDNCSCEWREVGLCTALIRKLMWPWRRENKRPADFFFYNCEITHAVDLETTVQIR